MQFRIDPQPGGYLKAEMTERDTAEETRTFVQAIVAALRDSGIPRVLISIRSSRPVFKVEQWGLSGVLEQIAAIQGLRVAFISDSRETAMSQDYIALIARQRGLAFQAFAAEPDAIAWLTAS
jgi:hypothetical protein